MANINGDPNGQLDECSGGDLTGGEPFGLNATDTWCPQCGQGAEVDEDGLCFSCGCTACGVGAEQACEALRVAAAGDNPRCATCRDTNKRGEYRCDECSVARDAVQWSAGYDQGHQDGHEILAKEQQEIGYAAGLSEAADVCELAARRVSRTVAADVLRTIAAGLRSSPFELRVQLTDKAAEGEGVRHAG